MSSPVWNKLPIIGQVGDTLKLLDRGDWATQEGAYPERTCVHWERRKDAWFGWEDVGGSVAPKRSKPEEVLLGEKAQTLKIGVDNFGWQFRVQVWAGVQSDEWDDGSWVEWGSDRSTRPTPPEYAFSNVLTVERWGQPPPPPPAKSRGDALAASGFADLRAAELAWLAEGLTAAKVDATLAHAVNVLRGLRPENRERVKAFIRELESQEE